MEHLQVRNTGRTRHGRHTAQRIVLRLLFCILLLFFLTGPGCQREKTLRVGILSESNWDVPSGTVYDIIDEAIGRFEAEHPGVHVEYVSGILREDYSEWLMGQILLGEAPDVFLILPEDFHILASLGALQDLTPYMEKSGESEAGAYYPSVLACGEWGGRQMALPYECAPRLMFVNRTLLTANNISMPGQDWTWEDFYEICRLVTADTDGNGVLDQFGCCNYTWTDAAYANGCRLFNEAGTECYVGDEAVEAAVHFVEQLEALRQGTPVTAQDFDLGHVAFQPLLFSEYRTYSPYPWRIKKYTGFEWECLPMPAGPSGGNVSELEALLVGLSSRSAQKDLAWEFLSLLTCDEEIQEQIFRLSQGASGLRAVVTSQGTESLLNADMPTGSEIDMRLLDHVLENAVTAPSFRKYEEAMAMLNDGVRNALEDEKNIHTSLVILQRRLKSFLKN